MLASLPVRYRAIADERVLHVSDTGEFFASGSEFLARLLDGVTSAADEEFLIDRGHIVRSEQPFSATARLFNLAQRWSRTGTLDYLILVPTLRCNLSCSYCQVSRVTDKAQGFDWSDATLAAVLDFIDALPTPHIKIEFQGGEPTLRPDLIQAVIDRCERFEHKQFVICTNLQAIDETLWSIFDNPNLYISTSLDGTEATHAKGAFIWVYGAAGTHVVPASEVLKVQTVAPEYLEGRNVAEQFRDVLDCFLGDLSLVGPGIFKSDEALGAFLEEIAVRRGVAIKLAEER